MTDLDKAIEEALDEEDRRLLDDFGEQGIFTQWFSVYRGPQAWIAAVTTVVMLIMAVVAFYAIWKLFHVSDGYDAVKWGAAAWLLMTMVAFMKLWFWLRMESNRVIREIKRVELQVARLQSK